MWCLRGLLYAFGKDAAVRPEGRKYLYGIASLLVFAGLLFARHITRQLGDIAAGSPRKGGFRANFLTVSLLGNKIEVVTNDLSAATMSGVGGQSPKINEPGVNLVLVLKIDNSGQPSVAWNWKAHLVLPGGSELEALLPSVSMGSNQILNTVVGPVPLSQEGNRYNQWL
jgi:hypothetical protein